MISEPVGAVLAPGRAPLRHAAMNMAKLLHSLRGAAPTLAALGDELKRTADRIGPIRFWWRDDDAVAATEQLETLLAIRAEHQVPLALSVIPSTARRDLARRLESEAAVKVLQHGWDHRDHGGPDGPPAELADWREPDVVMGQLLQGRAVLDELFGRQTFAILVPPYNRIGKALATAVIAKGWSAVSVVGDFPGLAVPTLNVHADLIDWRRNEAASRDRVTASVFQALWARRMGLVPAAAPVGILTHHLVHSEAMWDAARHWLSYLRAKPEVCFVNLLPNRSS